MSQADIPEFKYLRSGGKYEYFHAVYLVFVFLALPVNDSRPKHQGNCKEYEISSLGRLY